MLFVFSSEIAKYLKKRCYSLVLEFNYIASVLIVNVTTLFLVQFNFMDITIPGRVSQKINNNTSYVRYTITHKYRDFSVFILWWLLRCTRSPVLSPQHTRICKTENFLLTFDVCRSPFIHCLYVYIKCVT